ncbi:hypothetical protein C2S51_028066 [Perilla frutescens var. frutescens]|nr:hypothetical protein C2S51_028066 [Perilla frutescens var. frutescens]
MASSQVEVEGRGSDIQFQLKHLGFLRDLTLNVVVLVSNVYVYAKQNSGSLKSSVEKAENAVAAVVTPVYQRFEGVPTHLLVFLDNKVDEASQKFDECAPPTAKKVALKVQLVVKKASEAVQVLAEEAKVGGPLAAVSRASTISKNFTVSQLAVVWYMINQHPTLHGLSEMATATATHLSGKYNNLVQGLRGKGYSVFYYALLIPLEEMAKAYKQVEAAADKKELDASNSSSSGSESDKE